MSTNEPAGGFDRARFLAAHPRLAARLAARGDRGRPSARASIRLARAMTACPYRSTLHCGCTGGRCALRGGARVSHRDCFPCLERYPD
jgi:hypothetical protein